ncbi:MAG: prepilin peptidase, partial [Desulfovibrio sp.]
VRTIDVFWPDMFMVWVVYMVCGGILIIASFIDFDSFILPDILTFPGAALALAGSYFFVLPVYGTPTLLESLIGAVVGALIFLILQQLYKKIKGTDGLGTGDIKLMLMLGAMVGWQGLPVAITAAAVIALFASLFYMVRPGAKGTQTMVPFGPFLSLGAMLYILFGSYYWEWLGR